MLRKMKKNKQITEMKSQYGKQPSRGSKCPECKKITLFKRINAYECQCVRCEQVFKKMN